jgi:hypothetical protein
MRKSIKSLWLFSIDYFVFGQVRIVFNSAVISKIRIGFVDHLWSCRKIFSFSNATVIQMYGGHQNLIYR